VNARGLVAALALCCVLGRPSAASDTLCLKDGRIFDDVVLQRGEGAILVKFQNGQVAVPLDKVLECVIENDTGFVPRMRRRSRRSPMAWCSSRASGCARSSATRA